MADKETELLIPAANAAAVGLGVTRRTIGRYLRNPPSGFPKAIRINRRLYFKKSELDAYKKQLIYESFSESATPGWKVGTERQSCAAE
jgi:predicted DNA-binding transcriptional regulator AlpA